MTDGPEKTGQGSANPLLRLGKFLVRWSGLLCVPGGVLWAMSPLGVQLSELRFHTPNVFWKLFPAAPILILLGLVGLQIAQSGRAGLWQKVGFVVALIGLVLLLIGDVGQFWLRLDDTYLMTAPAYRALRLGLILLAAGSILFGVFAPRDGVLPTWGILPFAVCSLGGLVAFSRDLGSLGAILWILFGLGWAWLGFSVAVNGAVSYLRSRRTGREAAAQG